MSCYFFEFEADNGRKYCVAARDEQDFMKSTNNGTEPSEVFRYLIGDVQKFLSCREVTEDYILGHYQNGSHYASMAKGVLSKEGSNFFWIG